ncbi:formin-like protein 20 [Vigna radiata var. radiata]|uniref:Formin-like protein 20 n=1 Tax=Vigna radiata var. radiata TaxID=3916 RepID=A0A1S3W2K6_VIGRR|nr:formin-like protein 20 [Vigna radiata var. radiata]
MRRHAPPPSPARVAHAPTFGETHSPPPPPQTGSPKPPESIPRVGDDSFGLYLSRSDFYDLLPFPSETYSPPPPQTGSPEPPDSVPWGLNHEYDPIRVQIFGIEKLPPLSEVFFMVRGEETRRSVMLHGGISNTGSAMTIRKGVHKGTNAGGKTFEREQEATNLSSPSQSNPPPPPPPDLDMKAYKEKLERLEAMIESMSKPFGSCTLSIKGSCHGEDDFNC